MKRVSEIIVQAFFTLLWNGISGFGFWQMLSGIRRGNVGFILPLLILSLFVGCGILYLIIPLIIEILYRFSYCSEEFYNKHSFQSGNTIPAQYSRTFPPLSFVCGAVICAAGLYLAAFNALPGILKWDEMREWEKVPCEARIMNFEPTKFRDIKGERLADFGLLYKYEYRGKEYSATGTLRLPESRARATGVMSSELKSGISDLTCWVRPANPEESALTRDIRSIEFGAGGMGLLINFMGMILLGIGSRIWMKNTSWNKPKRLKHERLVIWILLIVSWSAFGFVLLVVDACEQERSGLPFLPTTNIIVTISIITGLFIVRFLIHLFSAPKTLPEPKRQSIPRPPAKKVVPKYEPPPEPIEETTRPHGLPGPPISTPNFLAMASLLAIVRAAAIASGFSILLSLMGMPPYRVFKIPIIIVFVMLLALHQILSAKVKEYIGLIHLSKKRQGIGNLVTFILVGGVVFTMFISGPLWEQKRMEDPSNALADAQITSLKRIGDKPEHEPANYEIEYTFNVKGKEYKGKQILRNMTPEQLPKEDSGAGASKLLVRYDKSLPQVNRIEIDRRRTGFYVNGKPADPFYYVLVPFCIAIFATLLNILLFWNDFKSTRWEAW